MLSNFENLELIIYMYVMINLRISGYFDICFVVKIKVSFVNIYVQVYPFYPFSVERIGNLSFSLAPWPLEALTLALYKLECALLSFVTQCPIGVVGCQGLIAQSVQALEKNNQYTVCGGPTCKGKESFKFAIECWGGSKGQNIMFTIAYNIFQRKGGGGGGPYQGAEC